MGIHVPRIQSRLEELGVTVPDVPAPAGNYLPFVRQGNLVHLAGVAPTREGRVEYVGKVGRELTLAEGQEAARLCALNLLASLRLACEGDLDHVRRFVSVRGFVNVDESFEDLPRVINGASDLICQVFGREIGAHARTSIGCAMLPGFVAVELDALVVIDTNTFGWPWRPLRVGSPQRSSA